MTTDNTKYISPKHVLRMFKDNGVEYMLYRHARSMYWKYNDMYWEYWRLRDNLKDMIMDICTGYIENKRSFCYFSLISLDDKIENREIIVYEKKKISCANNSIEHMYVEVSPEEVKAADNYDDYYVNCEELLSVIEKSFIMEEGKANDH